jgi:hypothetical protein
MNLRTTDREAVPEMPNRLGIKSALQAFIAVPSTQRMYFMEIQRCRAF